MPWLKYRGIPYQKQESRHGDREGQRSGYSGARYDRLLSDWFATSASDDATIYESLDALRKRSSDLCRNNDYVRGARDKLVLNVVRSGIRLQSQVKKQRGEGLDEDANEKIEQSWLDWSEAENCDLSEKQPFWLMQATVLSETFEKGEIFVRKFRRPRSLNGEFSFALELIDAWRVPVEHNGSWQGNEIRMGIEFDRYGRRVAYWVRRYHPGEYQFQSRSYGAWDLERIPAGEIIHVAHFEHAQQTRGVPWIYSSIATIQNETKYEDYEIVASKGAACYMAAIKLEDDPYGGMAEDDDRPPQFHLEPGTVPRLRPNEDIDFFAPNRPNSNAIDFLKHLLRRLGAGLKLSFGAVANNTDGQSYSSLRWSALQDQGYYGFVQGFFVSKFLDPVYKGWLDETVLSGKLNLPGYYNNRKHFSRARWLMPGWIGIDRAKDSVAVERLLKLGLTTRAIECARLGLDFDEVLEEIAKEMRRVRDVAERYDISPGDILEELKEAQTADASQTKQ